MPKEQSILTLPSSHCIRNIELSISSITSPLTNACFESLTQTYRFPEKSFSPSIPPTLSVVPSSSVLMNLGANVPGAGDPCREDGEAICFEFDRIREETPTSASEFVRECAAGALERGDCMIADFDRACPGGGPGEGEAFVLLNGVVRQRAPFGA